MVVSGFSQIAADFFRKITPCVQGMDGVAFDLTHLSCPYTTHISVNPHARVWVWLRVSIDVHVYMHVYLSMYINTYTHTYMLYMNIYICMS